MKCLLCGTDMESGGIIAESFSVMWVPLHEFEKKGIKKLIYSNGKSVGKTNTFLRQTKISNAYFCSRCNKIIGIFDINKTIME